MIKKEGFMIVLLFIVFSLGIVSAETGIFGVIYDSQGHTLNEAKVNVSCEHKIAAGFEINFKNTTSLSDGTYEVNFYDYDCDEGDIVIAYAEKEGIGYGNSGEWIVKLSKELEINFAIANVTVPEFGFYMGALTLVCAVGIFAFVRRG